MGKSQRHALAIGFAGLVTFLVAFMAEESFHSLDAVSSDMAWRAISEETGGQSERRIVVVNIDEASIERYGPWPWPRELMAKMVARLSEEGVALQVFDVVFPSAKPGNAALAGALAKAPTVLAQIMAIESDETVFRGSLQGGITFPGCAQHFDSATAYIANHTAISAAAAGHITPRISADGGVRRIPAMVCYGDKAYPALVLAAVAAGAAVAPEFSYVQGSGFLDPVARLDFDKIPGLSIPLDAQGDILLPWWLSRSGIVAVSAEAVLEAQLPEGFLSGAWVLIGATAFGVADAVPTPLGGAVSGVEVHAQLMAALLDGRIPYTPRHAGWMQFFWAAFLALVLWAAACYLNRAFLVGVMVTGLGSMAITVVLPVLLLQSFALWLPWVLPATFVFLATGFVLIQQYYSDRRETIVLYRNLSSYLPEHVARKIANVEPSSKLQARHERAVVLYADLRNFSAWCNQLPADEVGSLLHSFYSLADEVIRQRGGVIEEYVGDAVLAVWRSDGSVDSEPVQAAQALVRSWEAFFGEETYQDSLPPLAVGVGIDYGDVLVGSFGSEHRRAYTVLGEPVSMAMRIQEMTEELAHPVILSQNAYGLWGQSIAMESLGKFLLSGSQHSTQLFYPKLDLE